MKDRLNVAAYLSFVGDNVPQSMTTGYPSSDGNFQKEYTPCDK